MGQYAFRYFVGQHASKEHGIYKYYSHQMDPSLFYGTTRYIQDLPSDNESDGPGLSDDEVDERERTLAPESDFEEVDIHTSDGDVIEETDLESNEDDDLNKRCGQTVWTIFPSGEKMKEIGANTQIASPNHISTAINANFHSA